MLKKSFVFLFAIGLIGGALADNRNEATEDTLIANQSWYGRLPFGNDEDFQLAERGLIARPESVVITDESGNVVWNLDRFSFEFGEAPATVNPSLWRQARLNMKYGLYEVTDGIYQVRGFDLANIAIIEGETGYIVVDPLLSAETARAAMALAFEHLPEKPVVAVIYSHSHADHFGGVKGVVSQQDVDSGDVLVVASEGFMDFAVAENVLAGNVMLRRAGYMYGSIIPKDEKGGAGAGLGKGIPNGAITLIEPTFVVTETPQEMEIDGVDFVFMNTPHAEAPAELMFHLPQFNAFYAAEQASGTLHNLYTMRGARVRDALLWSQYLHDAADLIPEDTEVVFGGHHWPRWGYDNIVAYLRKQGDTYRYIHDQTLRLANHGFTSDEISEQIQLPDELAHEWYNRGYYGTVSHNSRAVYQKYLGFFDGNPANMHPLPPVEAGKRYVAFMGGADALLEKARASYAAADYRWVAEVVNHLVFADPDNGAARQLQADALEQLGYQAESGQWRNFYLSAASELRNGVNAAATMRTLSADMINGLTTENLFGYLAVRLNGPDAAGRRIVINFEFSDRSEQYLVTLENAVLHHAAGKHSETANATVTLSRPGFLAMMMMGVPVDALLAGDLISIDGDAAAVAELVGLLDTFEFWFNIVTP